MAARHTPHTMKHELLEAVVTGNTGLLTQVLGLVGSSETRDHRGDESCLKGITAEGSTPLHIAASHGHLQLVELICNQDKSLLKARNSLLDTPLICAARSGHVDAVGYLAEHASANLEAEDDPVLRARNLDGATAMHEAVRNGHAPVLEKLMSMDRGIAALVDARGLSPLYLAVVSNRADMVDILIGEAPDGVKSPASFLGPDRQTALHAAVYFSKEMSETLLRWEPKLAEMVDAYGRTALQYAALAGKTAVMELLLENSRSLAYIPDSNGLFPVHTAAIAGKANAVRQLMGVCPNCDELLDNKRRNILHCAVEHGRPMVVMSIYRSVNKFTRMMMNNARDGEGNTPLHLAVKHGRAVIASFLMMDVRVNLDIMNDAALTPLDVAFQKYDCDYTFSLLTYTSIAKCLQLCQAYRSPCHMARNVTDEQLLEGGNKEKESSNYSSVSKSILYISVLIAASSFAAAFAVPGGTISEGEDAGLPIFAGTNGYLGFVTANSLSFYCSTIGTCLLVHASLTSIRARDRRNYLTWSAGLVGAAVFYMLLTFTYVMRLTLDPANSWNEYLIVRFNVVLEIAISAVVIWPVSVLAIPMCLRGAMKLHTSMRPWHWHKVIIRELLLIAYSILANYVVYVIVFSQGPVLKRIPPSARQEAHNWCPYVNRSQCSTSFPYPT